MSVKSVDVANVFGGVAEDGERKYTKIYKVRTTDAKDGPIIARQATGIENYGDTYSYGNESDAGAYAISISAALKHIDKTVKDWLTTVVFSSQPQTIEGSLNERGDPIDNPLQRPVRWSGSFVKMQELLERDKDGSPIINTAGDLLEGLTRARSLPNLRAIRNTANVDLVKWAEYSDAVNSDNWLGLSPRMAQVQDITFTPTIAGPYRYFETTYDFLINFKTFDKKYENRGMRARASEGEAPEKISGIVEPAFLDEYGVRLSDDEIAANAFYQIEARVEDELPFKALGLPNTIKA